MPVERVCFRFQVSKRAFLRPKGGTGHETLQCLSIPRTTLDFWFSSTTQHNQKLKIQGGNLNDYC